MAKYNWRRHRKAKTNIQYGMPPIPETNGITVCTSGIHQVDVRHSDYGEWAIMLDEGPMSIMHGVGQQQSLIHAEAGQRIWVRSSNMIPSEMRVSYAIEAPQPEPVRVADITGLTYQLPIMNMGLEWRFEQFQIVPSETMYA